MIFLLHATRIISAPLLQRHLIAQIAPREYERVILLFFCLVAAVSWRWVLPLEAQLRIVAMPPLILAFWAIEKAHSRPWTRVARDFLALGLIVPGYLSLGLLSTAQFSPWQQIWIGWDRILLYDFGMKAGVEGLGPTIPFVLELAYLLLYAFPPAALLTLNLIHQRSRIGRYLLVLFLGTFTAYLLLPVWPVLSPRFAYPGVDLPLFEGSPRNINVWLLNHLDIATSAFPSGHVAVAMSNAFGLLVAVPSRHKIWGAAFGAAGLVYAATIYGRYHYAMDGLASIVIATAAWRVGAWLDARGRLS